MAGDLDRLLERGESLCGEHRKVWPECASLHPEVSGDLPDDKRGEPAFTRHGAEDCPECCAPVGTRHLDGCSGQFHESAVGTAHEEADR